MSEINVDALAEKAKRFGGSGKKIIIVIALLIVLWIAIRVLNPFVLVGAGERGVVLNFGAVQDNVLGEGLRLRVPVMQKIALVDVRIQKSQTDAESLRLQKENVTPQLIQLRKIEASIKAIEKWDGHMPKITSGAIPFIDMKSIEEK